MKQESFVGPDWRVPGWIEKGYIHEKRVKTEGLRAGSNLVLAACPDELRQELREYNKEQGFSEYVFEEDLNDEDIVFIEV